MTKRTTNQSEHDHAETDPTAPAADATPTAPETPPVDDQASIASETPADPPVQPEPIDVKAAEAVVYRYSGTGAIAGVPPRDLTRLDAERLVPEQIRAMVVAAPGRTPIYEAV
jgi:hypothetical protein